MIRYQSLPRKLFLFVPVLILLIIAAACGEDATATPRPTATAAPTATTQPTATAAATTAAATPTKPAATATPTAEPKPTSTPAPAFMTSNVDRLVIAQTTQYHESTLPYEVSTPRSHQHAIWEALIGLDSETSLQVPRLATDWSMAADGMSWTFNLREGVDFHFGYGEMTSKDVRHTLARDMSEDAIAADHTIWKGLIEKPEDVELAGDHTAVFHLLRVEPDLEFFATARNGAMSLIMSKAQYDDVGGDQDAVRARPAATGAWRFKDYATGEHFIFERVEDHWRKTAAFKEMQLRYAAEESTRLAMLLAGEAHMADLSRQLQEPALAAGMARVSAGIPGSGVYYFFPGNWHSQPELMNPDNPLINIKVREAIVHAIDRQTIVSEIFQDRGPLALHPDYHPTMGSWDPTWAERAKVKYSYDPDLSMELLAEAGYPDGFDLTIKSHLWPGQPEMQLVDEALAGYLQAVGINAVIETVEYSRTRQELRNRDVGVWMLAMPPWNLGPPHVSARCCYASEPKGYAFFFTHPKMDELLETLDNTLDLKTRDDIQREMGNLQFDNYMQIPLVQLNQEITLDPKVIKRYPAPGGFTDPFTHLEYVEPVS